MESAADPSIESQRPPPLPVAVLDYAASGALVVGAVTVAIVRALAIAHLLVGAIPLVYVIVTMSASRPEFERLVLIPSGIAEVFVGILLFLPRPSSWRRARIFFAIIAIIALVFVGFGVALLVIYRHATGWDQLSAALGGLLAILASIPFALNVSALWYLMRPHPRAMFGVSVTERFAGRKIFVRTLWGVWIVGAIVVVLAYILP